MRLEAVPAPKRSARTPCRHVTGLTSKGGVRSIFRPSGHRGIEQRPSHRFAGFRLIPSVMTRLYSLVHARQLASLIFRRGEPADAAERECDSEAIKCRIALISKSHGRGGSTLRSIRIKISGHTSTAIWVDGSGDGYTKTRPSAREYGLPIRELIDMRKPEKSASCITC